MYFVTLKCRSQLAAASSCAHSASQTEKTHPYTRLIRSKTAMTRSLALCSCVTLVLNVVPKVLSHIPKSTVQSFRRDSEWKCYKECHLTKKTRMQNDQCPCTELLSIHIHTDSINMLNIFLLVLI